MALKLVVGLAAVSGTAGLTGELIAARAVESPVCRTSSLRCCVQGRVVPSDASPTPDRESAAEAYLRFRRRRQGDALHGGSLAQLEGSRGAPSAADAKQTAHPDFCTALADDAGFTTLALFHRHSPDGDKSRGSMGPIVGAIKFVTSSQDETVLEIERVLSIRCAELKNVDMDAKHRGKGGGEIMVEGMADELRARGYDFVLLSHLDRGTGKLVKWYERLGFRAAHEVLPANVQGVTRQHMIAEVRHLVLPKPEVAHT